MLTWLLWGRADPGAWHSCGPAFRFLSLGEFIFPAAEAGLSSEGRIDIRESA